MTVSSYQLLSNLSDKDFVAEIKDVFSEHLAETYSTAKLSHMSADQSKALAAALDFIKTYPRALVSENPSHAFSLFQKRVPESCRPTRDVVSRCFADMREPIVSLFSGYAGRETELRNRLNTVSSSLGEALTEAIERFVSDRPSVQQYAEKLAHARENPIERGAA